MALVKYGWYTLAAVIGTELVYKLFRYIQSRVDEVEEEKVVTMVLFFPDEGIIKYQSRGDECEHGGTNLNNNTDSSRSKLNQKIRKVDISTDIPGANKLFLGRSVVADQHITPLLSRSTSLVHLVRAVLSAKRTLRICLYIFTCKQLADAVVLVKQRGVEVRVYLERQLMDSSMGVVTVFHQHHIPVRYGSPARTMHHKFAVVDGPTTTHSAPSPTTRSTPTTHSTPTRHLTPKPRYSTDTPRPPIATPCISSASTPGRPGPLSGRRGSEGIVMSGSFNWTWSAVINNYENVFITNDANVVGQYAREFDKIWCESDSICYK